MIYTVTFNPSIDYVLKADSLSTADINRAKSEHISAGGKGINVSVMLARLGVKNRALGFLAGFSGRQIEDMLKEETCETDFIYLKSGYSRINVKIRADKELDINANGPVITANDFSELLKKLENAQKGDYIVLAGSVPPSLSKKTYGKMIACFSEKGIHFVVDTTGDFLKSTLKYSPFLIKPNHHELGDLFSVQIQTEQDAVKYARRLQQKGARNVLVSRGENGAMLLDENQRVYCADAAKGQVIDTVGCGDAMLAGFLAGFMKDNQYENAFKYAMACGSATAFSEGLAQRDMLEKYL